MKAVVGVNEVGGSPLVDDLPMLPGGFNAERRDERKLIADYEALMDDVLSRLDKANLPHAIELASVPDMIRGFGPVKAEAMAKADEQRAQMLERFNNPVKTITRKSAKEAAE